MSPPHVTRTHADLVERRNAWRPGYIRRIRITDFIVVVTAVVIAQLVRFGTATNFPTIGLPGSEITYTVVSVSLIAGWLMSLSWLRTRSPSVIGSGTDEYKLVIDATFRVIGGIAILALLLRVDFARGYLAVAFPVGLAGLLVTRWLWRIDLVKRRKQGSNMSAMVVIGSPERVIEVADRYARSPGEGFKVVGACVPGYTGRRGRTIHAGDEAIPIFGDENMIIEAINYFAADSVTVTATEQLGPEGIRQLIWALEPHDIDLMITPGVADVAGPRMRLHVGAEMSMLHIGKPTYSGAQRFTKSAFDVCFAIIAIIAVLPVMVVTALAIKVSSRGPVFVTEDAVGLNGKPFKMIRFRTHEVAEPTPVADGEADTEREEAPFTRVGKFVRRCSIDELPKFFNVLLRHMSVVGPRTPVEDETVPEGDGHRHRRLLVRPGLTGLWQIAGGSELSPDDGVRLDLYYVENWSMVTDCLIILKTVRAVLRRGNTEAEAA